jgi:hypothetical protein
MLVPWLIDIVVPLLAGGYLMLVILRFVRGTPPPEEKEDGRRPGRESLGKTLGTLFFLLGVYLVITRLIHL